MATEYAIMGRLCEAYDDYADLRAAWEEARRAGMILVDGMRGNTKIHPAFSAMLHLNQTIRFMESSLGFTPTDRARLGLAAVKKERGKLDEFLERHRALMARPVVGEQESE